MTRRTKRKLKRGGNRKRKPSMKSLSRKVKKENCSPYVKKRNSVKDSCFTDGNLIDLKNIYNKKHPNDTIKTNQPVKIWKQLAEKTKNKAIAKENGNDHFFLFKEYFL